ncbi:hypothetical protein BX616_004785 [Lobosporangium transversale]|uniref:Amine oxidase domain-containing protein n=1 Tax=Lobosporangium transversale TaxID=64571 RepID=A0A1Y2H2B2_9FUNG|nr:hypothetical protein BCR41DRAFT_343938 [Lobosporangium transversale]KAF9916028.1 hypothetical protein BX616_004785 [Lobosporangium transversale]ORZ28709.1 hypothetical protein BCR41DRAFT_343938 [Lobosporangium transversale]|eukprot:XP_021886382.1 hypothetical protein BCR41DRAFT_343938 [Lobosporangium transversale]
MSLLNSPTVPSTDGSIHTNTASYKHPVGDDLLSPTEPHQHGTANSHHSHPLTEIPLKQKLRVAVVGSGLAGLTVAHILSSLHSDNGQGGVGIEVELFEKAHKLGMDAASLSVTCPCQKCALAAGRDDGDPNHEHVEGRMDVPMRSFFPEYYPNLVRLYRSIDIKFHDADNTLACFDVTFDSKPVPLASDPVSRLNHDVNIGAPYLSSRSYKVSKDHTITLPDLPPLSVFNPYPFGRRLLGYYRIARDYVRMLMVSKEFMTEGRMMEIGKDRSEWGNGRQASLREFLVNGRYSHDFAAFFVPLFACVCTCSFERMMEYPACVVLEYVARCMPFGRMQFVSSGVREVTENLSKNISKIHYNTMIEKIIEADVVADGDKKAPIILVDSNGVRRGFDHVIFATQANQAATTLAGQKASKPLPRPYVTSREEGEDESNFGRMEEHDRTDPETPRDISPESILKNHPFYNQIKILSKFPYERTQVVCHTDTSFLPKDPSAWRLLNIAKATDADILASPFDRVTAELKQQEQEQEKEQQQSIGFSIRPFFFPKSNELNQRINKAMGHDSGISSPEPHSGSSTPTSTASQSHNSAMATHIMNNTAQSLGTTTKFLQTTNPIFQPRPDTVISSAWFERAVVNPESMKAVDELYQQMEKQTDRLLAANSASLSAPFSPPSSPSSPSSSSSISDRVWFVGSYAYPGIPLLEGCVVSAVQVMERIIEAEPSHRLAPSVTAPKESFLKRDAPMRERRLRRKKEATVKENKSMEDDKEDIDNSISATYFRTAWKDTLEDERIWEEQEKARQVQEEEAAEEETRIQSKKGHFLSAVGSWTNNVYVEVAFMLLLYIAAIVQWLMVFMIESAGFDGSRWALA